LEYVQTRVYYNPHKDTQTCTCKYSLTVVKNLRPHSHCHEYRLRVIHTSGAFMVTHSSTNTCNSVAIKILVQIVKCLEFLAKVYSNIAGNVVHNCLHQNYVISSLCAV